MADGTKIEWTEATWNPITGCRVVSPGCKRCYAMKLAGTRLRHHPSRKGLTDVSPAGPVWNGKTRFNPEWLDQPLRWRRPRRIFVVAHGDLFYDQVPDAWIDKVFAVMALAPRHTFQVLTKRADRARDYLTGKGAFGGVLRAARVLPGGTAAIGRAEWPLPNVWVGFSAEDQRHFDERAESFLPIADAGWLTWCSAEPLLGPIRLAAPDRKNPGSVPASAWLRWVVAGGESDSERPMHPDWPRALRDECRAAGIPFLFKQWGDWKEVDGPRCQALSEPAPGDCWIEPDGKTIERDRISNAIRSPYGCSIVRRVGKKAAGRMLDGRTWDEYPA